RERLRQRRGAVRQQHAVAVARGGVGLAVDAPQLLLQRGGRVERRAEALLARVGAEEAQQRLVADRVERAVRGGLVRELDAAGHDEQVALRPGQAAVVRGGGTAAADDEEHLRARVRARGQRLAGQDAQK